MKSIELTEEHKSKLLEMCEKLFPEQIPFCIGLSQELRKGWGYSREYIFGKVDTFEDNGIIIHWFEFCMTHLVEKVLNPKDEISKNMMKKLKKFYYKATTYSWFIQNPGERECFLTHPVDYLYEEFKKLKV